MMIYKDSTAEGTLLELEGALDTLTAPDLQKTLLEELAASDRVTLDFTGLAYVSSAGLRALLVGQKTANAQGRNLVLTHVSPEVMNVLKMTGFCSILNICP